MFRRVIVSIFLFFFLNGCSLYENIITENSQGIVNYEYQGLKFLGVFAKIMSVERNPLIDTTYSINSLVVYQNLNKSPKIIELNDEIDFEFCFSTATLPNNMLESTLTFGEGSGETIVSKDNFPDDILSGLLGKKEGSRVVIFTKAQNIFGFIPHGSNKINFSVNDILIYQFDIVSIKKSEKLQYD